jgi:hypothetical protein
VRAEDSPEQFYSCCYAVLDDREVRVETLSAEQLCEECRAGRILPRTLIECLDDGRIYRAADYAVLATVFLQARALIPTVQKPRRSMTQSRARVQYWYLQERSDASVLSDIDVKPVGCVVVLLVIFSILILMFSPVDLTKPRAQEHAGTPSKSPSAEILAKLHFHR